MAIDVVIPLFNGGPFIEETLESVFAQSAELGEVVVVDDGSSDDGRERVSRLGRGIRLLSNQPELRPRQVGLLATASSLVAFLDQDDVWHAEHLARLESALGEIPTAPAAASPVKVFQHGDRPRHELRPGALGKIDPWATWPFGCPIWTPSSVLFRRTPLVAAGGWRHEASPDWQTYLRLASLAPIVSTPSATCAYRHHPGVPPTARQPGGRSRLDAMQRAVEAAFEERMATEDDEAVRAMLERRRRAYESYDRLLRALERRDAEQARTSAQALEHELVAESDAYLTQLVEHAAYLCRPDDDADRKRQFRLDLLGRIADALPDDARRLRDVTAWHAQRPRLRWRRLFRYLLKGRWPSALRLMTGAERGERGEGADGVSW